MSIWKHYHLARSIPDALQILAAVPGPAEAARCVAGGTDLLLDLQQGRHAPVDTLVDVTEIPEINALEVRNDALYIGAGVPLSKIVLSPLVREHCPALTEACGLIGGPQVRNTATLGGNVAHALPAADGAIALLALNAAAEVFSMEGGRRLPLSALFLGPGKSALDPRRDLLAGFYLPLRQPAQGSAHRRVMRPQGVAIAILNMAVWVARQGEQIQSLRIALGPAGPTPRLAEQTAAALVGGPLSAEALEQAGHVLLSEAKFRTSPHRAGAEYRRHLAGVLLKQTLQTAWDRTF